MLSWQRVLFHFCCFCLPVFVLIYCLHLACPASGSEDCGGNGQYLCEPTSFTNKSLSGFFILDLVWGGIHSSLSLFFNLMTFSKGPHMYINEM